MGKRDRYFQKIEEYKEKYRGLSTEMIRYRLNELGTALFPEARIALGHLLKEREQQDDAGMHADSGG